MSKKLSDGTKKILKNIEQVILERKHPSVEYVWEGVIRENFTDYDLTIKENREKYVKNCRETIAFMTMIFSLKHKESGLPFSYDATLNIFKLDPWLSLYILVEDLDVQMETLDLVDGFDPEE